MKKIIYLIALISFLGFVSCGSSSDKDKTSDKKELSDEINDCDDFLAHYEEWVDDYVQIIDDYLNNPSDEAVATRYMELMQEAMTWSTKWIALADCAEDEEYEQKFEEVSKKIEEKLTEIGM